MVLFNIFIQDGENHTVEHLGQISANDALSALEIVKSQYGTPKAPLAIVVTKAAGTDFAVRRQQELLEATANRIGVRMAAARRAKKEKAENLVFLGDDDLFFAEDSVTAEVV
jgi:hypothetical protein